MNIAIVGAGNGGNKLLELFSQASGVRVALVIDKDLECEGIKNARSKGVNVSDSLDSIHKYSVDVIVEATGSKYVNDLLIENYGSSKNIIDSDFASVMMDIVDKQTEVSEMLNKKISTISYTTDILEKEVANIHESSQSIGDVSGILNDSMEKSREYVLRSDDVIKSVNRITQQIKILGLNANIEAARAGEAGRGFTVVASEVQKLSDITSNFAKELSVLLESISEENSKISEEVEILESISHKQQSLSERVENVVEELVREAH
jgi:methyl-accepting chemotaxis protein